MNLKPSHSTVWTPRSQNSFPQFKRLSGMLQGHPESSPGSRSSVWGRRAFQERTGLGWSRGRWHFQAEVCLSGWGKTEQCRWTQIHNLGKVKHVNEKAESDQGDIAKLWKKGSPEVLFSTLHSLLLSPIYSVSFFSPPRNYLLCNTLDGRQSRRKKWSLMPLKCFYVQGWTAKSGLYTEI